MEKFTLHAKTLFGLEDALAEELRMLGAENVETGVRLVAFTGDQRLLYRANACCRTAIRILKPIASFAADSEQAFYQGVQRIDWAALLDAGSTLWIDPLVHSSFTTHSRFAAQLAKDAIVDQFRQRFGRRPSVDRDQPDLRIALHLAHNQATIYLDSSGESLHMRGYRQRSGEAPLNETLAAGVLRLIGWDRASPLVDPMCGSGTLLIEAAMAARNIAPVLLGRDYAFARWKDYDRALFQEVYAEAAAAQRGPLDFPLVGGDIDPRVLQIARENARCARVADDIRWEEASFECAEAPAAGATLVTNPPYDERLKVDRIASLYGRLGDALKQRFAGCTAWVLSGNLAAAKQIGLRPTAKIKLFNGAIECRLLRFDLYAGSRRRPDSEAEDTARSDDLADRTDEAAPPTPIASSAHPQRWIDQAAMFKNRLARMGKHVR
ncbi:MAG: hypothetical protein KDA41_02500, partial [Planctomycetales bacterium]|nr:hypothetical protein [Planctomycetales bacterium]